MVGVECAETAAWQLQRDSWLKFETSQERPAGDKGRRPEFIPASTFEKKRLGYVFKTDEKGTGYYLDSKAIKVTEVFKSHTSWASQGAARAVDWLCPAQ